MKLYFGNSVTAATTFMIIALLGFVAYAALNRDSRHWGIRSLILLVFGLVVCCFAAARDGFDKSVQNVIDGSCDPGIFGLSDIPTVIGYIGALLIVVAAIEKESHMVVSGPEIISRGFVYVRENESLIEEARKVAMEALEKCQNKRMKDWNTMKSQVRDALNSYIYETTKRSPIILPIFLEV